MSSDAGFALIPVHLTPRAGRDEIAGWSNGVLQARVRAAPVDGKANDALCRVIAEAVGVAPGRVSVLSGRTARTKRLRIEGMSGEEVLRRLGRG